MNINIASSVKRDLIRLRHVPMSYFQDFKIRYYLANNSE